VTSIAAFGLWWLEREKIESTITSLIPSDRTFPNRSRKEAGDFIRLLRDSKGYKQIASVGVVTNSSQVVDAH